MVLPTRPYVLWDHGVLLKLTFVNLIIHKFLVNDTRSLTNHDLYIISNIHLQPPPPSPIYSGDTHAFFTIFLNLAHRTTLFEDEPIVTYFPATDLE